MSLGTCGVFAQPQLRHTIGSYDAGATAAIFGRHLHTHRPVAPAEHSREIGVQDSETPLPDLEVRPSAGKGLGLFAVDTIPAYSRLAEDHALLSLADGEDLPQLWQKYNALPPEHQQVFDGLSIPAQQAERTAVLMKKLQQRGYPRAEAARMAQVSATFQGNAFKTRSPPPIDRTPFNLPPALSPPKQQWSYAVFATVARINHSCTPNAHASYRPSDGAQVVYALREILPSEEIVIAYFDLTMPLSDRQRRSQSWNFICTCPACTMADPSQQKEYERQLCLVHRYASAGVTDQKASTPNENEGSRNFYAAIAFADSPTHEWLRPALPNLYHALAVALRRLHGPRDEIVRALQNAMIAEIHLSGRQSPSSRDRMDLLRALEPGDAK